MRNVGPFIALQNEVKQFGRTKICSKHCRSYWTILLAFCQVQMPWKDVLFDELS